MNAANILKLHNIKKTPARLAIIEAIGEEKRPLSELEIKTHMGETYDRITFYRNMHTLASSGIVHKIVVNNTVVKYGLNCCDSGHVHRNEHAHFYCESCDDVTCMNEIKIPSFVLPEGFALADSDIIIKGKCKKCNH